MSFVDIATHTLKAWIEKVAKVGRMKGTVNGKFEPDKFMTRAEMAVMFADRVPYTWAQVYKLMADSVVYIEVGSYGAHGTGVVIQNGYVITAGHVPGTKDIVGVRFKNGKKYTADLIFNKYDKNKDIALFKIRATPEEYSKFNAAKICQDMQVMAEQVMTIGHPENSEWLAVSGKVERDKVAGRDWEFDTDLNVNPGNSGGPVFNLYGEVLGLISRSDGACTNVVYFLPDIENEING